MPTKKKGGGGGGRKKRSGGGKKGGGGAAADTASVAAVFDDAELYPSAATAEAAKEARRSQLRDKLRKKMGAMAAKTGRVKLSGGPSSKVDTPDGDAMDLDEVAASLGGGGKSNAMMGNMLESMRRFGVKETLRQYDCSWDKFKSAAGMDKAARKRVKAATGMDMAPIIQEAADRRKAKKAKKQAKAKKRKAKKRDAEREGGEGAGGEGVGAPAPAYPLAVMEDEDLAPPSKPVTAEVVEEHVDASEEDTGGGGGVAGHEVADEEGHDAHDAPGGGADGEAEQPSSPECGP